MTLAIATEMITIAENTGPHAPKRTTETESLPKKNKNHRKGIKTSAGNAIKARIKAHIRKNEKIEERRNKNKRVRKFTISNYTFKSDKIAILSQFFQIASKLPTL